MDNLWKGIAIAGIWISVTTMVIFIAINANKFPKGSEANLTGVFILATVATWIIADK